MTASRGASNADREHSGQVPGDESYTRWRSWFSLLTGRMNERDLEQYRRDRDTRMEEADCKRCETYRDYLLQYSKTSICGEKQLIRSPSSSQVLLSDSCETTSISWVETFIVVMCDVVDVTYGSQEVLIPIMAFLSVQMSCVIEDILRTQ